jgi:quercetin dioxygenase-like cupin family protein
MADATGAYVYQPGEGELRWMGETSTYFLATGEQTGGAFCLVDERASRGESVPLHRHRDDMESFYVVEGEITLYIGDQPGVRAPAGSFAHLPVEPSTASASSRKRRATSSSRRRDMGSSTVRSPSRRDLAVWRRSIRSKARKSSRRARITGSSSWDHSPIESTSNSAVLASPSVRRRKRAAEVTRCRPQGSRQTSNASASRLSAPFRALQERRRGQRSLLLFVRSRTSASRSKWPQPVRSGGPS